MKETRDRSISHRNPFDRQKRNSGRRYLAVRLVIRPRLLIRRTSRISGFKRNSHRRHRRNFNHRGRGHRLRDRQVRLNRLHLVVIRRIFLPLIFQLWVTSRQIITILPLLWHKAPTILIATSTRKASVSTCAIIPGDLLSSIQ